MKRLVLFSLSVFTCLCVLVAAEGRAWGYVDPGSGLLALQSFASVAAAAGYFLRRQIKAIFTRKPIAEKPIVMPIAQKTGNRNAA